MSHPSLIVLYDLEERKLREQLETAKTQLDRAQQNYDNIENNWMLFKKNKQTKLQEMEKMENIKAKQSEIYKKMRFYRIEQLEHDKINSLGIHDKVGFSGSGCDSDCEGWDGRSRRCNCGNNRVKFDYDSDDDTLRAISW